MDAVLIIISFLLMIIPMVIAKLWWWVVFWLLIASVLGIFEIVAKVKTGKTISQMFWIWVRDPKNPKWLKWTYLAGMIIFWAYLICHLFISC